jgi:ligand-binding SRPBCC domain-containing protein
MRLVELESLVAASPARVWERASTFRGINHELGPLLRMTAPRGLRRLDPSEMVVGEPLGRSWLLLLGVLPIDFDDLTLVELEPGRRFLERSRMLSMRVWEHERTLEGAGDGCRVRDRLAFEPRLPGTGALLQRIVRATFRHRHRRLRAHFG